MIERFLCKDCGLLRFGPGHLFRVAIGVCEL